MAESILESVTAAPVKKNDPNLLQTVLEQIESKVPDPLRDNYDAIVVSSSKILWEQEAHEAIFKTYIQRNIKTVKDVPMALGKGIPALIGLIIQKSGRRPDALAPAAMVACQTIMIHVLIYLQKRMKMKITERVLAESSHAVTKGMFKLFGITRDKFKQVLMQLHAQAKEKQNEQLQMEQEPEGAEEMPFDEGQELPPEEEALPEEALPEEAGPAPQETGQELPPAEGGEPVPAEEPGIVGGL